MPKKFLRRHLPKPKKTGEHNLPRWLQPLVADPYLLHLNRHSVSVAFFVGLFCALLPIPGQTLVATVMALLLRCNLPLSVALVWLTNPLTMTPVLILTYKLGSWVLGTPPVDMHFHLTWEWFSDQGKRIMVPLFTGGVLGGLAVGALGYLTIQGLWRWTVVRNWENRRRKRLIRLDDDSG